MAEIELIEGSKSWGDFNAVIDFNLIIKDKEFLVLLGPSGCGKTTTMRMIAGLEDLTDGIIKIDNKIVNDLEPKDRDISMVFQSYGLYPNMTVYENVRFPLKIRKIPKENHNNLVMEAINLVELSDFCHRKPSELSGGQKQRVALARALVRKPNVFLMDEPLSNLDAKLRVSTRGQIKHLQNQLQITTIYVTHDKIDILTTSPIDALKVFFIFTEIRFSSTFTVTIVESPKSSIEKIGALIFPEILLFILPSSARNPSLYFPFL